jgi:hypothetical protein
MKSSTRVERDKLTQWVRKPTSTEGRVFQRSNYQLSWESFNLALIVRESRWIGSYSNGSYKVSHRAHIYRYWKWHQFTPNWISIGKYCHVSGVPWLIIMGSGLNDWIFNTLYIYTVRAYRQLQRYHYSKHFQFTVAHALEFSVFTNRFATTNLYSLKVTSNVKSSWHGLIILRPQRFSRKNLWRESERAWHQDELIGGKPPVVKEIWVWLTQGNEKRWNRES